MKVKELIEELKKVPQDSMVWTEGCDCYGKINGVKFTPANEHDAEDSVLLERP